MIPGNLVGQIISLPANISLHVKTKNLKSTQ